MLASGSTRPQVQPSVRLRAKFAARHVINGSAGGKGVKLSQTGACIFARRLSVGRQCV